MEIKETKYDLNERVRKGSDIGIVRYSKSYLVVMGTLGPIILGLLFVGNLVNMKDPLVGLLFCALMVYVIREWVRWIDEA